MMKPTSGYLLLASLLVLAGCSTIDKLNPFTPAAPKIKIAELPAIKAGGELRPSWQVGLGSAGDYSFTPAVVGASVFAASKDGALARIDGGATAWRITTGVPLSGGVGADGKLVVVGTAKGEVLTFDAASGKELWRARVSSEILAAPAVSDGLVVVRSGDSKIYGLDATDGKRRWVYQRATPTLTLRSTVGVLIDGKQTLAGFPGGKLVAIANNNGAALWEVSVALPKGATELERVADVTSNPVVSGSIVCAAAYQGRVSCFDTSNGTVLWSRELSSSAGIDMDSRHVYAVDDKGIVQAFDRQSGASVWRQDKLSQRTVGRPLALAGHVAVADFQGYVHLLATDSGAFAARAATDGSAIRANLVRQGEALVAQTANGSVVSLAPK